MLILQHHITAQRLPCCLFCCTLPAAALTSCQTRFSNRSSERNSPVGPQDPSACFCSVPSCLAAANSACVSTCAHGSVRFISSVSTCFCRLGDTMVTVLDRTHPADRAARLSNSENVKPPSRYLLEVDERLCLLRADSMIFAPAVAEAAGSLPPASLWPLVLSHALRSQEWPAGQPQASAGQLSAIPVHNASTPH